MFKWHPHTWYKPTKAVILLSVTVLVFLYIFKKYIRGEHYGNKA